MRDVPIIFSGPMVRALLAGQKVQTRRLAWGKQIAVSDEALEPNGRHRTWRDDGGGFYTRPSPWQQVKAGDRLWVRENFRWLSWDEDGDFWVTYDADKAKSACLSPTDDDESQNLMERICAKLDRAGVAVDHERYQSTEPLGITPCIHMPRWASRLTLIVTDIKAEQLNKISEDDARAEGIFEFMSGPTRMFGLRVEGGYALPGLSARETYMNLWCDLHGPSAWNDNPEVIALTFTILKHNIDALPKVAAA
jgi:hypothetical protein